MGVYVYGLESPSKCRNVTISGVVHKIPALVYACRAGAFDTNILFSSRKYDTWRRHGFPKYIVMDGWHPGASVRQLPELRFPVPRSETWFNIPWWYDCDRPPGREIGVLAKNGRTWVCVRSDISELEEIVETVFNKDPEFLIDKP
jgi:hypothetical protein